MLLIHLLAPTVKNLLARWKYPTLLYNSEYELLKRENESFEMVNECILTRGRQVKNTLERTIWILKLADPLLSQQTCDKIILIMDIVLK